MKEEKRNLLKVLSILLQYPDDEFVVSLEELKNAVEEIPQMEQRERCVNFLDYLGTNPLIRLQEEYTVTFDFNPATSLNLTYHKFGDTRERGKALVGFHQLYKTAGYECTSGELPDYLPLLLEFLSINRQECDFSFLGQYGDQLKAIGVHLQESGSPYASIMANVLDIFRELETNGA
ncbi:MAG: nitrate reductase molybdenum cofactor assembly chaperone [Deltaproteobacteria bacterium]|nr:MAG: nitrate reductase molybdenum cofactor assembly chaperone [Deltaproteobacteria bacterium]